MYLTAHRVKNPTSNEEGINTFYHEHGTDFEWPAEPWNLPETNPGPILHERIEVLPGGNSVLSHLDILAPDGTPSEELDEAVTKLYFRLLDEEFVGTVPNPTVITFKSTCIRFGVSSKIEKRIAELLVLKVKLMSTRVVYFFQ